MMNEIISIITTIEIGNVTERTITGTNAISEKMNILRDGNAVVVLIIYAYNVPYHSSHLIFLKIVKN